MRAPRIKFGPGVDTLPELQGLLTRAAEQCNASFYEAAIVDDPVVEVAVARARAGIVMVMTTDLGAKYWGRASSISLVN